MSFRHFREREFSQGSGGFHQRKSFHKSSDEKGIGLIWILGFIFALAVIGVLSLFIFFSGDGSSFSLSSDDGSEEKAFSGQYNNKSTTFKGDKFLDADLDKRVGGNVSSNETGNDPSLDFNSTLEGIGIDCGEDLECLISVAENCGLANATLYSSFDFFGDIIETTYFYQIKGVDSGKCNVQIEYLNQTHRFSEEMKNELLEEGYTDEEELVQQEADLNEASKAVVGVSSICDFDSGQDLVSYLSFLDEGNIGDISFKAELGLNSSKTENQIGDVTFTCETFSP